MKKLNESVLEVGDIILTTTAHLVSKGIRVATSSEISHAMIYVQSHSVIDATSDGVHARNTERLVFDDACAVYVLRLIEPLSNDKMSLVINYARGCVGTEYSTREALKTVLGNKKTSTRKQFCSRLVARAYAHGGVSIVSDADYCTPDDLQKSALLRTVENPVQHVSQDDIEAMQRRPNTPQRMLEATNTVLAGARKVSRSIQDLNDLDSYLMTHPEHDKCFASLYQGSGYLTVWAFEKQKNEWQYDLQKMIDLPIHEREKMAYCEDLLRDSEAIRRFEAGLVGYKNYFAAHKLETFRLLHDLYAKLVFLHMQRVEVARNWIVLHSTRAHESAQVGEFERLPHVPKLIVTSTAEWIALPELTLPAVNTPTENGAVYNLHKVGFFLVPNEQISEVPEKAQTFGARKILPTAVVDIEEEKVLFRLPLELTDWASTCVSMAHAGHNAFPCEVEFGRLDGRAYAEFL